ncbi:hypothetical protein P1X14_02095 [Sphingomonas sp. AOB5]|uniref:hypothetical protein n=1 Tax=Sphingomonas sp. AOB5 TaxID=3034017 RepID=UPI0023F6681C|nr:hypothetical protein [Sphingomonas sp. AOB5]MDF7774025.1 hypothetical protein [Sphingomonas sp. AOB5]
MIYKFAAALALSFAAAPAMAQDMQQVDGWYLAEVRPGVCQMVAPFQDPTMISFIASETLPGMIVLIDETWKLENGGTYQVQFSWDNWRSSRSVAGKANLSSNGRYTIGMQTDIATNRLIRQARRISVRVPQLGIDSSVTLPANALAALVTCFNGG